MGIQTYRRIDIPTMPLGGKSKEHQVCQCTVFYKIKRKISSPSVLGHYLK
jgi:hypothetical protein